ncbi:MAG: type I-C CRISPR-associated protein Cas8c/Csd1, partial [Eubacterium sp.]
MLLQALVEHYERLIKNGRIPKSGFSSVGVSFVIKINKKGELINVISCKDREKKRMIPRMMTLPERVERSGKKINANFLCDNSKYMFGFGKDGVTEEYQKCFEAFKILHLKILKEVNCCEAKALLTFLENWMPQNEKDNSVLKVCIKDILAGGNLVFSVEDFSGYIHENEQIQNAWHRYKKNQKVGEKSQCLVTGEKDVIARVHPSIKSIQGGQSRGSKLVSFNA